MKRFCLAIIAFAIGTVTASAADMAVKAPPPPVAVFNWTGFYIGGFVGGAVADGDAFASEPTNTPGFYNGTGLGTSYGLGSSFNGGGTVGYNWQRPGSNFVLGIEGEVGYLHLAGSRQDVNARAANLALNDSVDSTRLGDWYGVIASRAGWAVDRALFYVKGGAAFVNHTYSFTDNCIGAGAPGCGPGFLVINRGNDTQFTYAVGAGVEYAFNNNWSVKGEYLYLGTQKSYTSSATSVAAPAGVLFTNTNSDPGIHTAKIGVNYRWGSPVVAKY
ncbi:MAG TPA: outer membrane beta-barrel protein [Terriglobales bacterium]|nr:outer membrane beta-barrel protein [Terriglobales bacterium]